MERTYRPLPSHAMAPKTSYQQPVLPPSPHVDLEDPAADVMTDFGRVRAITVPATVSMDYASERMRVNRVHLLLVTDQRNTIVGLITSTDIDGERPLVHMRQFAMRREELSVADIMTPSEQIEVIEMADVIRLQQRLESRSAGAVQFRPALALEDDKAFRLCGSGRYRRTAKAGVSRVTPSATRYFNRNLPHIFNATSVDTGRTHACHLAFAAVDSALCSLERDIATVAGRPDNGATDLRAESSRYHACSHGCGRTRGRTPGRALRVPRVRRRTWVGAAKFRRDRLAEHHGACLS